MVDIFLQKLNTNGEPIFTYVADNMRSFNVDINTPVTALPLPQESLEEQILIKVEGNSSVITLGWTIIDQTSEVGSTFGSIAFGLRKIRCSGGTQPVESDIGRVVLDDGAKIGYLVGFNNTDNDWFVATNKSPASSSAMTVQGGTASQSSTGTITITQDLGNILTANEQLSFFYTIFEPKVFTDKHRLRVNDIDGTVFTQDGFFHQQTFRLTEDTPVTYDANVTFFAGNSVAAFESDTPNSPVITSITPGSGQLAVSWNAPSNVGGSAITDYLIQTRKQGTTEWKDTFVGSAATTKTVTGLASDAVYSVKVAGINSAGQGSFSVISTSRTT